MPTIQKNQPRLEDISKEVILSRLRQFNGHRTNAAKSLGISLRCLHYKLRAWEKMELNHRGK